jgi:hypothetical protein
MAEWEPSGVTEVEIQRMEEDRLALENALVVGWHPHPTHAVRALALAPSDEEIVSFTDFHLLGLGLPLHPLVRGLLFFYGLGLHDLTQEGILHIATFITLCEAFLGIAPHFALWRWVFQVVPSFPSGAFPAAGAPDRGTSACCWPVPCPRPPAGFFVQPKIQTF